jgi:Uma2 family endonuclease
MVFEVLSPGRENRRRGEQDKVDEYESVPTILRYVIVESERRGYQVFWREPGDRAWRRKTAEAGGAIAVPEFGIEVALDEVYAGVDFG